MYYIYMRIKCYIFEYCILTKPLLSFGNLFWMFPAFLWLCFTRNTVRSFCVDIATFTHDLKGIFSDQI